MSGPDFRELVGDDLSPDERARLQRVHELLVSAGPPPDLPPALERAPTPGAAATGFLPRRRRGALLALAAALAAAAFGAGFLVADRGGDAGPEAFETDFSLVMRGTQAAPGAVASLVVGKRDDDGNWPMELTVRNLPPLGDDERYELYLTRGGEIGPSCGTFFVQSDKAVAHLNAPYKLKQFDGWVIVREGSHEVLVRTDEI
jgi:hypothetical protein